MHGDRQREASLEESAFSFSHVDTGGQTQMSTLAERGLPKQTIRSVDGIRSGLFNRNASFPSHFSEVFSKALFSEVRDDTVTFKESCHH